MGAVFMSGLIGLLTLGAPLSPDTAPRGGAALQVQYNAQSYRPVMTTPQPGSELRRALMDTMRPPFEDALNGPVEFVVQRLVVMGDWAYAAVKPQRPGGRPIDWSRTRFAREVQGGSFSTEGSAALMRFTGGRWTLVDTAIGPTDVYWIEWQQKFNLPEALFTGQ